MNEHNSTKELDQLIDEEPGLPDRLIDFLFETNEVSKIMQVVSLVAKDADAKTVHAEITRLFPRGQRKGPGELRSELRGKIVHEFKGEEYYFAEVDKAERKRRINKILTLFNGRNAAEVARRLQISRATVYRVLKQPGKGLKA